MSESRLTLRELRILAETERELRADRQFAALFEEPPRHGSSEHAGPLRLWLPAGIGMVLGPLLTLVHPGIGVLLLLSAMGAACAAWIVDRPGPADP